MRFWLMSGDAIADELALPFDLISLEMVYRGLYHFSVAYTKGKATNIVKYFAEPENRDLVIVKTVRKPQSKLDLSPLTTAFITKAQFS